MRQIMLTATAAIAIAILPGLGGDDRGEPPDDFWFSLRVLARCLQFLVPFSDDFLSASNH